MAITRTGGVGIGTIGRLGSGRRSLDGGTAGGIRFIAVFLLTLPMAQIERLCLRTKLIEGVWLAGEREGVLDVRREAAVVHREKCAFFIAGDGGELIELDIILGDMVGILHDKLVQFIQC